jgi:hypothetical protein
MRATKTGLIMIAMSILSLAPAAVLAQPIQTQTVTVPIVDSYMIPTVNNLLAIPGANSDSCESWTNTQGDNDTKIVTRVQQCYIQGQQPESQQPHSDPLLTSLLSNY